MNQNPNSTVYPVEIAPSVVEVAIRRIVSFRHFLRSAILTNRNPTTEIINLNSLIEDQKKMKRQLIAILWLVSLAFSTAWAAPTAQLFGGRTTVTLAPEFVDALVSLGVTPSDIYPGNLNLRKGKAKFPIPGGVIDLDSLKGDIYHNGGLGLGVPGTQVSLLNFIISTTDVEEPVLTGVAAVNGDVVDRIVLFNLDLSEATVSKSKRGILRVKNVGVTLSAVAADTLNTVFGVDAFVEDLLIGTADVITRARAIDHYDDEDEDEDEDD